MGPIHPSGRMPLRAGSARSQAGAALLTAMVIVTLVTTIAASMVWQQWRSVQVEAAERSLVQSQWLLVGALDYGRIILRSHDQGKPDHLGEPWALGLAETRISSLLAADKDNTDDAPDAFLSGNLVDATSRYNLFNLFIRSAPGTLQNPHEIDQMQLQVLKQLCQYATVSPGLADALAQAMRRALLAIDAPNDAVAMTLLGGPDGLKTAPLLPQTLDQLVWLGIDAITIERLRPFVIILPEDPSQPGTPTLVNVNTASREVIASVVPGADLGRAERVIQMRQRKPFENGDDAMKELGINQSLLPMDPQTQQNFPVMLTFQSSFFEVKGRLRLEDRVLSQNYLVKRENNKDVNVLLEERVSGVQPAEGR